MSTRLLLALFGAVLTSAETLKLGYGLGNGDLQFDFAQGTKTGGRSFFLTVEPWTYVNQGGGTWTYFLSVRLYLSAGDCPQCVLPSATASVYYKVGAQTASASDIAILNNTKGSDLGGDGVWVDIPLTITNVNVNYAFFINWNCPSCSSSAELTRLEAIVRMKDVAASNPEWYYGGFDRDGDRNTDWFNQYSGGFGPIMRIQGVNANDNAFVLGEISDLSLGDAGVVYYFATNMSSFLDNMASYDAGTLSCASASQTGCTSSINAVEGLPRFARAPAGNYTKGEFPVQATLLRTAGTWYSSAFVMRRSITKVFTEFRFAMGINAMPAPAAVSVPHLASILVALCLGLLAKQ